jgi:deferrochelatase/peroxidase EfeB
MDSLVTIVAPIRDADVPALDAAIDALGNPARPAIKAALDRLDADGGGTHFMSLHAIPSEGGGEAHLVLEFTADAGERRAMERIVGAIGEDLKPVFQRALDYDGELIDYLAAHRIKVGQGIFSDPGLCFAGTPAMSVGRIRGEAELAGFVQARIDNHRPGMRPIDRLAEIRRAVEGEPGLAWALEPPPPPLRTGTNPPALALVVKYALPFLPQFLWPFGVLLAVVAILLLVSLSGWHLAAALILAAVGITSLALGTVVVAFLALRKQERNDWADPRAPDAETLREIGRRENHCAQNHMVSITRRKPGPVRWLTLRVAFWSGRLNVTRTYTPGTLSGIDTIHAARWVTIPGTRQLVFFSNYGGSWESYLEDFITLAHEGLTGVWSNTIGFPPSRNFFEKGATDGERFKRFARASMRPTRFWYTAYPELITDQIRTNAGIRRGLAAALSNDEAGQWLALFGSAPRPEAKLETSQIQSLVFGGLGFMPHGVCLLLDLPRDEAKARAFVAALYPRTAFGDGRKLRRKAVLTVALGAGALERLGLPADCLAGFPPAFLEGMATEVRARILGDQGADSPERWEWGRRPSDIALLAYGKSEADVAALEAEVGAAASAAGMAAPYRIPLVEAKKPAIEPFGFVDGVSQPVIRGSDQANRDNDPIHLVQPGEFVIGYPDDRGNFPPEPELSSLADPKSLLPIADRSRSFGTAIVNAPRAIARNGTYLVIRQLEQDVEGFTDYCAGQVERLAARLPEPYEVDADFVAAKLIGRWKDGSSLVRNPYYPYGTELSRKAERDAARKPAETGAPEPPQPPETARPQTAPTAGASIPAPTVPSSKQDNDFLYGTEDPQALRCPIGAHIRRGNPRDTLRPGSLEQVSISNRHRIRRVGRLYAPKPGRNPGLLFMCLNGDIERQFEFVQQTWLANPGFQGLSGEQDPLINVSTRPSTGYTVPSHDGPARLAPLPSFVRTLGGGYFFMPGRSFLAFLGGIEEPWK